MTTNKFLMNVNFETVQETFEHNLGADYVVISRLPINTDSPVSLANYVTIFKNQAKDLLGNTQVVQEKKENGKTSRFLTFTDNILDAKGKRTIYLGTEDSQWIFIVKPEKDGKEYDFEAITCKFQWQYDSQIHALKALMDIDEPNALKVVIAAIQSDCLVVTKYKKTYELNGALNEMTVVDFFGKFSGLKPENKLPEPTTNKPQRPTINR